MKNITLLIKLFTLSFTLLYSQNLISEITEKYDDGKTKTISYYQNNRNKLVLGKIENYYKNRQLQSTGKIKDDLMDGEWIYYYENGQIKGRGLYKAGNGEDLGITGIAKNGRIGQWVFYYENGKKKNVYNYDYRGVPNNWTEYYENGRIQLHNTSYGYTSYYENGQIESKGKQKDGLNVGKWTEYYENGEINKELYYKEGIIDGIIYIYYENGKIMAKGDLKEGAGLLTFFYENGKKQKEGNLINEEKSGDWIFYDEEGRFVTVEQYKNGELVEPSPTEKPVTPVSPATQTGNSGRNLENISAIIEAELTNKSSCKEDVCISIINHNQQNKTFDVYMINQKPVAGFQCDLAGINIIGADGGLSQKNEYQTSNSADRILSYNIQGTLIPIGEGILTTVYYSNLINETCMTNIIFAGNGGVKLTNNTPNCLK